MILVDQRQLEGQSILSGSFMVESRIDAFQHSSRKVVMNRDMCKSLPGVNRKRVMKKLKKIQKQKQKTVAKKEKYMSTTDIKQVLQQQNTKNYTQLIKHAGGDNARQFPVPILQESQQGGGGTSFNVEEKNENNKDANINGNVLTLKSYNH